MATTEQGWSETLEAATHMPDHALLRELACRATPDGKAIQLEFRKEDGSEERVWIRTDGAAPILLHLEQAIGIANAIQTANQDGAVPRNLVARAVSGLAVSSSLEGHQVLSIRFVSGMEIHLVMDDSVVSLLEAILKVRQSVPKQTRH
jgi:hypothetical protein